MDAKRCDRCGEFYINDSTAGFFNCRTVNSLYLAKYNPIPAKDKTIDLCCDCRHDLDEWFNKFKKEEQNNECKKV